MDLEGNFGIFASKVPTKQNPTRVISYTQLRWIYRHTEQKIAAHEDLEEILKFLKFFF